MRQRFRVLMAVSALAFAGLLLLLTAATGWATERRGGSRTAPTLARLSFWLPPQRMSEFEAAYQTKVVPILKKHGLTPSSERARAGPDSIFSRLFEVKTPSEVADKDKALREDPAWKGARRSLGIAFGTPRTDSLIRYGLRLYSAPARPGKVVPAGPGRVVSAGGGTGHWRTYDAADGFAGVTTLSIFQDREGYLWFGSFDGGVSRYDGKTWTTFTKQDGLADNRVLAIFQDREGYLWFGTEAGGVSRFDGKAFTTFTQKDGLAGNLVFSIIQDQEGYLWFGTAGSGGVSRFDGKTFTTFTTRDSLAYNGVWSVFQDRDGVLWFGTTYGGVSRYDPSAKPVPSGVEGLRAGGKTWTAFTAKDGLAGNSVISIIQDREGYLWFGTWGGGVSRYDPSAKPVPSGVEGLRAGGKTWTTFTTRDGLAGISVSKILQDRDGYLWFATGWVGTGGGVSRYDGKTFVNFTTRDGLAHNEVYSLFQDREGHLWFGGNGGVTQYDARTWTTFTTQDGLTHNDVGPIFQDREGHLWFGTEGGVSRYDGKTWTTFTAKDGLANNSVRSILQDREGHLWFGTYGGGVSRYDGKTFSTFTAEDGLAGNLVRPICMDREGHLWFGTQEGGVSRYDGRTFTTFTPQDGLANVWVMSIFQDREGHLWFGTRWGDVSRYDGKTFTTFTTRESAVVSIFQDREGHLWMDGGGVRQYDPLRLADARSGQASTSSGGPGKTFKTFSIEEGLAGNTVSSIIQDREGHLWFGNPGGGVSRYDGQTFQTIVQPDGLGSNVVKSILQDREGHIWFGTSKGATRYRPPPPSPPPVFIDAVVSDRRYEKVSDLAVPSSVGLTVFEYHGISFKTRPEGMVYRYRLRGYDKDWRNTRARRMEYQNLPRGTYTFEVVAVDRDLVYSKTPATVTLRVHLPYTLIGLLSALGVALALVAYQTGRVVVRDRRLRKANEDLRREMDESQRVEEERMRLDERLQQVGYLYRLRETLGTARSSDEVFQNAGEALMEVLSPSPSAGVRIEHDGRAWRFGETDPPVVPPKGGTETPSPSGEGGGGVGMRYERGLSWGGKQRGSLSLFCRVELSESQERTLLDETAGQIAGVLESQELEMQILHSARLVSLGQMAAGVAHELNQPLTVISGAAEDVYLRLVEGLDISPEQLKGKMKDVLELAERMTGTVEHLRVFSRDTSKQPGVQFSVNDVIHSSLRLIEAQLKSHGIALHLDLGDGLPPVSGHPHQMEQVFLNLLGNARDALDEKETEKGETGKGGTTLPLRPPPNRGIGEAEKRGKESLRLSGSPFSGSGGGEGEWKEGWEKGVWVRTRRQGDEVVAEVEDNGAGMDEGVRSRLFEPFFTTKPADRGTGLGLSICYAIVRDHGGQIACESRKGEGTVFRVRLPIGGYRTGGQHEDSDSVPGPGQTDRW